MKKILNIAIILIAVLITFTGCKSNDEMYEELKEKYANEINETQNNVTENNQNSVLEERNSNNNGHEALLMKALKNEIQFIDEEENLTYLKDFANASQDEDIGKADKYCYVDLNEDGETELVVLTKSSGGFYMVFHYEENNVYGYLITIRAIYDLKTDGTSYGSGGAETGGYGTFVFNKHTYGESNLASHDRDEYKVNGFKATKEEYEEFVKKQDEKEDVEWHKFEE